MENIQLYHGDCLEIMKDIPDKSVDMVLCDLPFELTDNKWDKIIDFEKIWCQYNRIIKDNKESEYINFFQKQRNMYWLKKIKKYYTVTNEELLSMGTEHGFIMRRGEE